MLISDYRPFAVLATLGLLAACHQATEYTEASNGSDLSDLSERPHIILVMTDDQGYGDIGALGNPYVKTPHLDELHAASVRFTNFHVDPTCSPTRAALMTGQQSMRAGVWHTVMGRSMLPTEKVTMAEHLLSAGYRTAIFGKWHLGDNYPYRPEDQGFERVVIHGGGGVGQTPDVWGNNQFDDTYFEDGTATFFSGNSTDVWFDQAEAFLEQASDKPAFVFVSLNAPHTPWRAPQRYIEPYLEDGLPDAMALFYAMITHLDERIGQLRDLVETLPDDRPHVFIFMTDNGSSYRFSSAQLGGPDGRTLETLIANAPDGAWAINAGMRGYKASVYEGGHRVPLFIAGTDIEGGRDINDLSAHFDLLPTLLDIIGSEADPSKLDGQSLLPLIMGEATPIAGERTIVVTNQRVFNPSIERPMTVMTPRWRYVSHGERNQKELFDILNDPSQKTNVIDDHPEEALRLQAALEAWWAPYDKLEYPATYIPIGDPAPAPVRLTSMDWMEAPTTNDVPWFPGFEFEGPTFGDPAPWIGRETDYAPLPWYIDVEEPGSYTIELRLHDVQDISALDLTTAILEVGGVTQSQELNAPLSNESFEVDLVGGQQTIRAWMTDQEEPEQIVPAFYLYVSPSTE